MSTILTFESELEATRPELWKSILDAASLRREMMPFLAMSMPRGLRSLDDVPVVPGRPLFRSYHLYGGLLPLDYSDLTFVEMQPGHHFVEQSPMLSMKSWRHRREILDVAGRPGRLILRDTLTFEPRMAPDLAAWFVRRFFEHRHAMLRLAWTQPVRA